MTIDEPIADRRVGGRRRRERRRRRRVAPWIVLAVFAVLAGLFVVLAGAEPNAGEIVGFAVARPAGARGDRHARRRHAVRPVAPQGQLGGAQLLRPRLRAVHAGAPRAVEFADEQDAARHRRRRAVLGDRARRRRDEVDEFFDERGGDWPQIYSEFDDFPVAFGVAAVPETWIIDPSGVVQLRLISKVTAEQLDTILQQFREQYQ